jgi:hypothetical protein
MSQMEILENLILGLEGQLDHAESFVDELEDLDVDVEPLRDSLSEIWDVISEFREKHLK